MFPFVSDKVTEEADLNVRNNRGGARLAVTFACVPVRSASNAATPLDLRAPECSFFGRGSLQVNTKSTKSEFFIFVFTI